MKNGMFRNSGAYMLAAALSAAPLAKMNAEAHVVSVPGNASASSAFARSHLGSGRSLFDAITKASLSSVAGFSYSEIVGMESVQKFISFARLDKNAAENYLTSNWWRVSTAAATLIADRGVPGKRIGGTHFIGPKESVGNADIVEAVALDMLAEMFLRQFDSKFGNYFNFALNITNQESRFEKKPSGFNGAGLKQLTPRCIIAGDSAMTATMEAPGFYLEPFLYFTDNNGVRKKYVNVDGKSYSWNSGARNHLLDNPHLMVFYSALHFLYLHIDDPTRNLYRLARTYNGNPKRLPSGKTIRDDYADKVMGRLWAGWPMKPFSTDTPLAWKMGEKEKLLASLQSGSSERSVPSDGIFTPPEFSGEFGIAESKTSILTGKAPLGERTYAMLKPSRAQENAISLPLPMPAYEDEVYTIMDRGKRAQAITWAGKWKEMKAGTEEAVRRGQIVRLVPKGVELPEWMEQMPLMWTQERLELTKEFAGKHAGISTYGLKAEGAMLHWTAYPDIYQTLATFNPVRGEVRRTDGANYSSHFVIGRTGEVYLVSPLDVICRHTLGYMHNTFGIEIVAEGEGDVKEVQLESAARVVEWLSQAGLLPKKPYVFSHKEGYEFGEGRAHEKLYLNAGGAKLAHKEDIGRHSQTVRRMLRENGMEVYD